MTQTTSTSPVTSEGEAHSPSWPRKNPDEIAELMRDSALGELDVRARTQVVNGVLGPTPIEYVRRELESLRIIITGDQAEWFTREHVVSCIDHILREIERRSS